MKNSVLNYRPAQLSIQKENWHVSYYITNPSTNVLVRKRIKLNHIESKVTRRQYAFELIRSINQKLADGWNPYIEDEAPKSFSLFLEVIDIYFEQKEKELKPSSIQGYKSKLKIFTKWLSKKFDIKKLYIYSIDNQVANDFMQYLYLKRNISERRYNNYRSDFIIFWNWLIKNGFAKTNSFEKISKKKTTEKTRDFIDDVTLNKIFNYLQKNDIYFYAICCLCYYGLIRPIEILQLKKDYFDFKNNIIILPAKITKNSKQRYVTITKKLKEAILQLDFENISSNDYLFSNNFVPGNQGMSTHSISSKWARLRAKLDLPMEYQFYSLKDTGIIKMLSIGIPPNAVRDQAGHEDLTTTNKYIKMLTKANQDIIDKM